MITLRKEKKKKPFVRYNEGSHRARRGADPGGRERSLRELLTPVAVSGGSLYASEEVIIVLLRGMVAFYEGLPRDGLYFGAF